ncbi:hypothetical protein FBU30_007599 [Linnemannia zychae]|nr:hypothetical protein FBU30_007599 [Linnemannia zychae]
MAHESQTPETYFQAFRSERDKNRNILIPVVLHPTEKDLYIIWTDITACFPGATRIQYDNVYIPLLRNKRCYRVKPHGIRYHPGIVLDVIYGDTVSSTTRRIRNNETNHHNTDIAGIDQSASAHTTMADTDVRNAYRPEKNNSSAIIPNGEAGANGPDRQTTQDSSPPVPSTPSSYQQEYRHVDAAEKCQSIEEGVEEQEDSEYSDGSQEGNNEDQDSLDDQEVAKNTSEVPKNLAAQSSDCIPHSERQSRAHEKSRTEKASIPLSTQLHEARKPFIATPSTSLPTTKDKDKVQEKPDSTDEDERPSYNVELGDPVTRELISNTIAECRPALTAMAEANQKLTRVRINYLQSIDTEDSVGHRMRNIFKSRLSWTTSAHSRFFCFLPILEASSLSSKPTEANKTTATSSTSSTSSTSTDIPVIDFENAKIHSGTRFQYYSVCDCGNVPGFEGRWYPHLNVRHGLQTLNNPNRPTSETLSQQELDDLIPLFGELVMGTLEMIVYGAYIDNVLMFPSTTCKETAARAKLAIQYFESKGITSCLSVFMSKYAKSTNNCKFSLDDISPITPLDTKTSESLAHKVAKHQWEEYDDLLPYRTTEGDVRWICQPHWYDMAPKREWMVARTFSMNPASTKSEYLTHQGAFVAEITNRQRMVDYFLLAGRLTKTCILRVSLNWDMTIEDEIMVAEAIGTLSAAAIHITVRPATSVKSGSGLIGGTLRLMMAALRNPNLEAFKLFQRAPTKEKEYPVYDERRNILTSHLSLDALAIWMRPERGGKVKATLTVTDIDRAAKSIRLFARGLHHFSELCLTIEPVWKTVTIKFSEPGSEKPGCDIEDTDFKNSDILLYLEKREFCDEVSYKGVGMIDSRFLYCRCLTEVRMEFSLVQDRIKLRDVIKLNKNLRELQLENSTKDDPSQIYEAYKALLANHPSIRTFEICHRHLSRTSSNFSWRYPNDLAKMRLCITCFEGDKIQALFQKYALIIDALSIDQLQPAESATLEKAMRAKKGAAILRVVNIGDPHLMEASVLEDLKKIIIRTNVDQVAVYGSLKRTRILPDHEIDQSPDQENDNRMIKINDKQAKEASEVEYGPEEPEDETENAIIWADFLVSIRTRLTRLSVRSNGSIFKALERRLVDSLDFPRLSDLSLLGGWYHSLCGYPWIEKILLAKQARKELIISFHVSGATIWPDEWKFLLKVLDFSQLRKFHIEQENPLLPELLGPITDAIPGGKSAMEIFMVCDDRTLDGYAVLQYEEKIRAKVSPQNTVVMINGYTLS